MSDDVNEAPSTRHGDVLLTVWIIVGATVMLVLTFSDTLRLPTIALAAAGAVAAGYGEAVARALRPHVRMTETAVAVVIAFALLPHVARFGMGSTFDRDALVTMGIGTPLGLGAAWQMRRWNAGAGEYPAIAAGIFVIAAAVALAVVALVSARTSFGRHTIEVAFLLASLAGGASFGALVPGARPGHLIVGAVAIVLAPRFFSIGVMKHIPLRDVVLWTGALGIGGSLGCLLGRMLRAQQAARAVASNLPQARVHDGDAGETHDPR